MGHKRVNFLVVAFVSLILPNALAADKTQTDPPRNLGVAYLRSLVLDYDNLVCRCLMSCNPGIADHAVQILFRMGDITLIQELAKRSQEAVDIGCNPYESFSCDAYHKLNDLVCLENFPMGNEEIVESILRLSQHLDSENTVRFLAHVQNHQPTTEILERLLKFTQEDACKLLVGWSARMCQSNRHLKVGLQNQALDALNKELYTRIRGKELDPSIPTYRIAAIIGKTALDAHSLGIRGKAADILADGLDLLRKTGQYPNFADDSNGTKLSATLEWYFWQAAIRLLRELRPTNETDWQDAKPVPVLASSLNDLDFFKNPPKDSLTAQVLPSWLKQAIPLLERNGWKDAAKKAKDLLDKLP